MIFVFGVSLARVFPFLLPPFSFPPLPPSQEKYIQIVGIPDFSKDMYSLPHQSSTSTASQLPDPAVLAPVERPRKHVLRQHPDAASEVRAVARQGGQAGDQ